MINEVFDKIFWINSKNRMDRYKNMCKRLPELGINPNSTRFPAVLGGGVNRKNYSFAEPGKRPFKVLNNGEFGCYLSHLEIYKQIKANGWKRTLILEDDAEFCPDFLMKFTEYWKHTPAEWDMLYLGQWNYDYQVNGGNTVGGKTFALREPVKEFRPGEGVYNAKRCWLTHAYAVDINCIDKLIDGCKHLYSSVDNVLADVQEKENLKVIAYHPNLIKQDNTKSSLR